MPARDRPYLLLAVPGWVRDAEICLAEEVTVAATWCDALLQLDELEAALALRLAGWRGLALAAVSNGFSSLRSSMAEPPSSGLRYHESAVDPGAQTERRGEAGPVRGSPGGYASPAGLV